MSHFDIAPKFAGVTFRYVLFLSALNLVLTTCSLSNTVATVPGIAGVLIVGYVASYFLIW